MTCTVCMFFCLRVCNQVFAPCSLSLILPLSGSPRFFFSSPNEVSATMVQRHSSKGNWLSLNCKESFFVSTGRSLDPFSTERRLHKGLHNTHIHSAWQRGTAEQKKKEGKINSFGIRSQASHSHRVNAICMPCKAWQSIINGSNKRNNAAVIEGISP